jgi:hypothetical protein
MVGESGSVGYASLVCTRCIFRWGLYLERSSSWRSSRVAGRHRVFSHKVALLPAAPGCLPSEGYTKTENAPVGTGRNCSAPHAVADMACGRGRAG